MAGLYGNDAFSILVFSTKTTLATMYQNAIYIGFQQNSRSISRDSYIYNFFTQGITVPSFTNVGYV